MHPAAPPSSARVTLRSEVLEVVVLPDSGADVYAVIDRATGIDVLFKAPWGWRDPALLTDDARDEAGWLARYAGGWPLLLPHAGAPREVAGVLRGYHGEAAVVPWTVLSASDSQLMVSVRLTSAPLDVTRTYDVDGATLRIDTTVRNTGDVAVPVSWVEHPVFGADFVDARSVLTSGAAAVLADADDPGTVLAVDVRSTPAAAARASGGTVDLGALPGPGPARKVFAALTDFTDGWFAIDSPTAGFGVRVEWDAAVLPHAWLWQECHATQGFPWFGEAFAVAVEPANVIPGDPSADRPERGRAPLLGPRAELSSSVRLARVASRG